MKIMLDLDGVLANFVKGMCKSHDLFDPYYNSMNLGKWDMDKLWCMSPAQFWAPTNSDSWWASLEWMPDGMDIYQACVDTVGIDNVCILTACSASPECAAGKYKWMQKNLPGVPWLAGPRKAKVFTAHPGSVLVDDKHGNVIEYREAGGHSVLVPRPWNCMHNHDTLQWVEEGLRLYRYTNNARSST